VIGPGTGDVVHQQDGTSQELAVKVQREAKDGDSGVPARNGMNALAVADTPCNPHCGGASACNMDVVREGSAKSRRKRRWRRSVPRAHGVCGRCGVMTTSPTLAPVSVG
jgi:hypothetical protein